MCFPAARTTSFPLTRRLERAFAGRYVRLPRPTRLMILAAALSGSESTREAIAAAALVLGREPEPELLGPPQRQWD